MKTIHLYELLKIYFSTHPDEDYITIINLKKLIWSLHKSFNYHIYIPFNNEEILYAEKTNVISPSCIRHASLKVNIRSAKADLYEVVLEIDKEDQKKLIELVECDYTDESGIFTKFEQLIEKKKIKTIVCNNLTSLGAVIDALIDCGVKYIHTGTADIEETGDFIEDALYGRTINHKQYVELKYYNNDSQPTDFDIITHCEPPFMEDIEFLSALYGEEKSRSKLNEHYKTIICPNEYLSLYLNRIDTDNYKILEIKPYTEANTYGPEGREKQELLNKFLILLEKKYEPKDKNTDQ